MQLEVLLHLRYNDVFIQFLNMSLGEGVIVRHLQSTRGCAIHEVNELRYQHRLAIAPWPQCWSLMMIMRASSFFYSICANCLLGAGLIFRPQSLGCAFAMSRVGFYNSRIVFAISHQDNVSTSLLDPGFLES